MSDDLTVSEFGYDDFKTNLLALPITLVLVFLARLIFPVRFFLNYFCLLFHELGHASHAWASSRFAIPFPYGETRYFYNQSTGLFVLASVCCAAFGIWSFRERRWGGVVLSAAWIFLETWATYFVEPEQSLGLIVFGGLNGQFVIPLIGMALFYARMPAALRWDFWRYPVLFISTYVFVDAYTFWKAIESGAAQLPLGSMLQGADDPNGDIQRLLGVYGWTAAGLTATFLRISKVGLILVFLLYLFEVVRALWAKAPPAPDQTHS